MSSLSLSHLFRKYTQKLFPRKTKKAIQDWDFILVFDIKTEKSLREYFSNL